MLAPTGKIGGDDDPADDILQVAGITEMACRQPDAEVWIVGRLKEGQTTDVVQMSMCEEKVDVAMWASHHFLAQIACTRPTVDHQQNVPRPYFKAGCFSAVSKSFGTSSSC